MRAGHDHQVALVGRGHIGKEITNLQLQVRDARAQTAIAFVVAIDMPAGTAAVGAFFPDGVGGVEMGLLVEQGVQIGQKRCIVEQFEEEWVVAEDVEDARTVAIDSGFAAVELVAFLQLTPLGDDLGQGGAQAVDVVGRQKTFEQEVAVGGKGEDFVL